jgi:hypothetical protein
VSVPAAEWTIDEAASWLDPPITAGKLRALVSVAEIEPSGRRPTGHSGPGIKIYDASEILALHAAIAPWLVKLEDGADRR